MCDRWYEANGNRLLMQIMFHFILTFELYDYVTNKKKTFPKHSAWLESEDDEVVERVNRRIGAVTGLEMSTAEPLQVRF